MNKMLCNDLHKRNNHDQHQQYIHGGFCSPTFCSMVVVKLLKLILHKIFLS